MRKLLTILFLLTTIVLNATVYYCAPSGGNDSNDGTISEPWATWGKAFSTAIAGDTVYFRGGVWYPSALTDGNNLYSLINSGTSGNPISFLNYPGEVPILDCRNLVAPGSSPSNRYLSGIVMYDIHWIVWKGLTVRNLYQREANVEVKAFVGMPISNMRFENMTVYNIGTLGYYLEVDCGSGEGYTPTSNLYFINCDTYQCCDTLPVNNGQVAGNQGDGFKVIGVCETSSYLDSSYLHIEGCRAWHCADDGFDLPFTGRRYIVNNWSFNHTYSDYDFEGNGMKVSNMYDNTVTRTTIAKNLFAFCDLGLFEHEYWPSTRNNSRIYNNTIYDCKVGFQNDINNTENPQDTTFSIFWNNIIYGITTNDAGDRPYNLAVECKYAESNNTWDYGEAGSLPNWIPTDTVTVTDDDFVLIDSTTAISQLTSARRSNGDLPFTSFMKLASTSDLIDAGKNIGVAYYGDAPDIGYAEYAPIIADHTVIDQFEDIPQQYIDSVKKMLVWVAGMSHSIGYQNGLNLLEQYDSTYQVTTYLNESIPAVSDEYLRLGRTQMSSAGIWSSEYWNNYHSELMQDANTADNPFEVFMYAWCYDMTWHNDPGGTEDPVLGVRWAGDSEFTTGDYARWGLDADDALLTGNDYCMDTYFNSWQTMITHTITNGYDTKIVFTTGPVDNENNDVEASENGFQRELKQSYIRDYINANPDLILFDYADILYYNNSGEKNTSTWNDEGNNRIYDQMHPDNQKDYDASWNVIDPDGNGNPLGEDHIGEVGALRIAKATWWLLARIAGWEGAAAPPSGGVGMPSILTGTPIIVYTREANVTINSISDGGATITGRGVCWSTSTNPTITDNYTSNGSGTSSFTARISGLSANTTYYIRAYATNSEGTSYGGQVSITTPDKSTFKNSAKIVVKDGKIVIIK